MACRLLNHEVRIQWEVRDLANRRNDRRPDRHVRDKMSIHDIEVKQVSAPLLDALNLSGQMCKIGREN